MHRATRYVGLLSLAIAAFACGDNIEPVETIADHVRTDPRLDTLERALDRADILSTLDGEDPHTLFAPTDAAFEALFSEMSLARAELLELPQLEELMSYHVLAGARQRETLAQSTALATLAGPEIHVRNGLDGLTLNDGVALTAEPIEATNGVIYVLDAVLKRPLIAETRRYESNRPLVLDNSDEESFNVMDTLTITDETFIHDLRIFIDIEHPELRNLYVYLQHPETGVNIPILTGSNTMFAGLNATLADSAEFDIVNDAGDGEPGDSVQAFPESAYRPIQPLEFMLGQPLAGEWRLIVFDFSDAEVDGEIRSWGLLATAGENMPAPAIAIDGRNLGSPVFARGFTESATPRFRRVGGLEGEVVVGGSLGQLVASERTIRPDLNVGTALFALDDDAELGTRDMSVYVKRGDVSRIVERQTEIVAPDNSGIELLSHLPLAELGGDGSSGNDIWGWTDPATDKEIALVGTSTGTAFVDVTNPTAPKILGQLPTATGPSDWRDIKVYLDHAFIVSEAYGHGLQVFDLRQLAATNGGVLSPTAYYDGFGSAHNIAINEDSASAYVLGSFEGQCHGGLRMFDISNPTSPVEIGCWSGGVPAGQTPGPSYPTDVYTHDAQCVIYQGPDIDHQGKEVCFTLDESSVGIADVTEKTAVGQLSRVTYENVGYTHQGWLTEDQQFFIVNDEFDELLAGIGTRSYVFDVSDLDAPVLYTTIDNPRDAIGHNTYVAGTIAYQANYTSGLRMVDLSGIAGGVAGEMAYFDTYPDDDQYDDPPPGGGGFRCNRSAGQMFHHPQSALDQSGCGNQSYQGAWSNYPFFASGVVVVSDIDRGLFVLKPN